MPSSLGSASIATDLPQTYMGCKVKQVCAATHPGKTAVEALERGLQDTILQETLCGASYALQYHDMSVNIIGHLLTLASIERAHNSGESKVPDDDKDPVLPTFQIL